MLNKLKAVIFDLDGTMVDNMMIHHRAWQKKLSDLGMEMDLDEVRQSIHGVNEEILTRLFGDRFSEEERSQISRDKEEEYRRIFKPDLKLIPSLGQFLDFISSKNLDMAIGSAAPPENVDFVIDNLNIRSYFKVIKHARDVILGKPNPEVYLLITETLGLNPRDCLVFEDTPAGVEAALKAGTNVWVITTTHPEEEFSHYDGITGFSKDFEAPKLYFEKLISG